MNKGAPNGSLNTSSRAAQDSPVNASVNPRTVLDRDPSTNNPQSSTRQPTGDIPSPSPQRLGATNGQPPGPASHKKTDSGIVDPEAFEDWDDDHFSEHDPLTENSSPMPSDLRPPFHRPTDGKSGTPLLNPLQKENGYAGGHIGEDSPTMIRRRSTFKEQDPDAAAKSATRKRYSYAAFFLAVSLVSFTIQTETAVYIKKYLGWSKSYAML